MSRLGTVKVIVPKELSFSEERKSQLKEFLSYCVRILRFADDYVGELAMERETHGIETTAICYYGKKKFYVYAKGRAFVDILRSIAHELVHLSQFEKGLLSFEKANIHFASETEDEANKTAGQLLNAFTAVVGYEKIYEGKNANRAKALGPRRNLG